MGKSSENIAKFSYITGVRALSIGFAPFISYQLAQNIFVFDLF